MSHVKLGTLSRHSRRDAMPSPAWLLLLGPLVAAGLLAVMLNPGNASNAASVPAADPLLAPGMVEFRRDERLAGQQD
jgi:hypothetical protein